LTFIFEFRYNTKRWTLGRLGDEEEGGVLREAMGTSLHFLDREYNPTVSF
jgi:hypothetical protein